MEYLIVENPYTIDERIMRDGLTLPEAIDILPIYESRNPTSRFEIIKFEEHAELT